jgi:casein kinase II subunit alpha
MLAGMMFSREPFFKGADNQDQLVKIAKFIGTEDIMAYCEKYRIVLDTYYDDKLIK